MISMKGTQAQSVNAGKEMVQWRSKNDITTRIHFTSLYRFFTPGNCGGICLVMVGNTTFIPLCLKITRLFHS